MTLLHNVAARCNWGDLACFQDSKDGGGDACPAALAAVATDWRFAGNWRDTLGAADKAVIPLAARDHLLGDRGFVSVDPKSADFLRPSKEFAEAMATDQVPGAPPLPAYAGAMPPPGVEAWDWERTWHREDRP